MTAPNTNEHEAPYIPAAWLSYHIYKQQQNQKYGNVWRNLYSAVGKIKKESEVFGNDSNKSKFHSGGNYETEFW
jgi:hypothetical protein